MGSNERTQYQFLYIIQFQYVEHWSSDLLSTPPYYNNNPSQVSLCHVHIVVLRNAPRKLLNSSFCLSVVSVF